MGTYFRKRIKIAPGVNINLSKSGASLSVGPRGAKVNFGKRGTYVTTGIPGTGIYSRTKISGNNSIQYKQSNASDSGYEIKNYTGCLFSSICYILAFILPFYGVHFSLSILLIIAGFIFHFSYVEKRKKDIYQDNNSSSMIQTIDASQNETMTDIDETREKENTIYKKEEIKEFIGHIELADRDPLFNEAARLIVIQQQGSTSLIQRKFAISYNRAGRLMDQLEVAGIVSPFEGSKARDVLIKNEHELEQILERIDIVERKNEENELDNSTSNQAIIDAENSSRFIHIGQSLEKEGMIDEAIAVYEKSILSKIPATIPYERLMVLYRKKKDYENEIRIIKEAISVFMAENERRAGRVIEGNSSLYNEVMQALETNESIRYDNGKWAFVQYNVMDYITRLEKAKKQYLKSQEQTKL